MNDDLINLGTEEQPILIHKDSAPFSPYSGGGYVQISKTGARHTGSDPTATNQLVRVNTAQIGNKLFIMDGVSPLRYVDLTKNKVVQYKKPKKVFSIFYTRKIKI